MGFLEKVKNKIEDKATQALFQRMERASEIEENKPPTKWNRLGNALVFIIFFLFSLPGMYFTYPWLINGLESENWPTTDGIITSSEIYDVRGSKGGITYGAAILYEYSVSDKKYLSNYITSAGQSSSSDLDYAQGLINKYSNGTKITVYYNPNKPDEAVLEPGIHFFDLFPFGISLLFSLIGIIGFVWAIKGSSKPPKRTYETFEEARKENEKW